jgi:hypothetical protein
VKILICIIFIKMILKVIIILLYISFTFTIEVLKFCRNKFTRLGNACSGNSNEESLKNKYMNMKTKPYKLYSSTLYFLFFIQFKYCLHTTREAFIFWKPKIC